MIKPKILKDIAGQLAQRGIRIVEHKRNCRSYDRLIVEDATGRRSSVGVASSPKDDEACANMVAQAAARNLRLGRP